MTDPMPPLPPMPRRFKNRDQMQKWYALLAAPIFFMLAGALAFSEQDRMSTFFAILAMTMPLIFVILAVRDTIRMARLHREWQQAHAARAAAIAQATPPAPPTAT
jgi:hypothetical protein